MIKKILLFVLLAAIIATCFIPVTLQKTTTIASPFLNTYSRLTNPLNWEHSRPDLRQAIMTDSDKIAVQKDSSQFSIKYKDLALKVDFKGNSFDVNENQDGRTTNYSYAMVPVPDKLLNKTTVTISEDKTVMTYLIGKISGSSFLEDRLADLKSYLETDSLLYGFAIFKTGVPDSLLIVKQQNVLQKNQFTEAAKILADLQQYMKANNVKPTYPVIAQFNSGVKDSVQVKVGFFINKAVKSSDGIKLNRMPMGGPLYAIKYKGEFLKRGKAHQALTQYFADHSHQMVILPFETYLGNKLPVSDTDIINIQVNLGTFPSGNGPSK
jgi:effector-binding domain-containing protein